jgi:hypothetical protein
MWKEQRLYLNTAVVGFIEVWRENGTSLKRDAWLFMKRLEKHQDLAPGFIVTPGWPAKIVKPIITGRGITPFIDRLQSRSTPSPRETVFHFARLTRDRLRRFEHRATSKG